MKKVTVILIVCLLYITKAACQNTLQKQEYDFKLDTTYSLFDYQRENHTVIPDTLSKSIQIRPYKYSPTSQDGPVIVVIDGKVSQQGFEGLLPRDVESLSVLKGEKAKSLYGEGSVIIVTTRKSADAEKNGLTAQDRYSDINGQKFRFRELGTGKITVIFESGMSDSLEAWGNIPEQISAFAHVFLYDRADIGKSDFSRQERTIPNMVSELRSILEHEKIQSPYIIVGHSMGGYIARYYTSMYPRDVKGLLLLDPVAEAYWQSMSEKELEEYVKGGTEWYRTKHAPKYAKEWFSFIPNMAYMKDLKIPASLPVILVSSSESGWAKYQKEILKGLDNSKQVRLKSGHYIHRDHPEVTIGYIKELAIGVE